MLIVVYPPILQVILVVQFLLVFFFQLFQKSILADALSVTLPTVSHHWKHWSNLLLIYHQTIRIRKLTFLFIACKCCGWSGYVFCSFTWTHFSMNFKKWLYVTIVLGRLYQVEYAMEAIGHAGTCLGILASDGIVLAAEKRNTNKLLDELSYSEKIYRLHEWVVYFSQHMYNSCTFSH